MFRFHIFFYLVLTFVGVYAERDPEPDLRRLPKLFHLDDYEQCLDRKDGVFCLGLFEIYSDVQPNPFYDLIQEKSQDLHLYNRSHLHRGYCLPTRCPSSDANATARFERCVDDWAREHSLRARLHTLHYCRAHGQPKPRESDTADVPHRVLLYFVGTLLFMAVVGTFYDFFIAKKGSKNPFLMSFSLRINLSHFTSNYRDVDPRLRELEIFNGIRFFMVPGLILCHVYILTSAVYQHNPRSMEKLLDSPTGYMLGASMTITLLFIVMSNFLTTYNMLLLSNKIKFSLKMFPLLVLKRVIRMYPVYLLMNGFAATWWKSFGDGPMWPVMLAAESETCRKKFWITAGFMQNFFYKKELCLVQTWIMAVDMQLHLFTLLLTLILLKHRQYAVHVLSALLVLATGYVTYEAFEQDLVPSYLYMTPEVFQNFFIGADSFFDLYIHPMNGIIFALTGTLLAFIHKDHQEKEIRISNSKLLVFLHYASVPSLYLWCYQSWLYFRHFDRWTQNLMVPIERVVVSILLAFAIYSLVNHKGFVHKLACWRGFRMVARLSFSVSMSHWCINVLLLTNRRTLHDTSSQQVLLDVIGVYVLSHVAALFLTILVEYPLQKFLDRLLNRTGQRWFSPLKAKSTKTD